MSTDSATVFDVWHCGVHFRVIKEADHLSAITALQAQIAELQVRQVPDGWVAVPLEPTKQMLEASGITDTEYYFSDLYWAYDFLTDCYRSMIAAAPSNPTTQPPEGREDAQQEQSK